MSSQVISYDAYQDSFHRAFEPELYRILDDLPIRAGSNVLDVPCGNGFYGKRLMELLRPDDNLTAVDANDKYLRQAREKLKNGPADVVVKKADAYELPFEDKTFNLVWCAQSLISLDPLRAVREMHRVTKPHGVTAILEVDEFHHVLLPWPIELEAALPLAIRKASLARYGDGKKLAPSRRLRKVLQEAEFKSIRRVTYAFDRAAPFDRLTTKFLAHHLVYLKSIAYTHLPAKEKKLFDRMTDSDNPKSLFGLPDAELVCINAVYFAKPVAG